MKPSVRNIFGLIVFFIVLLVVAVESYVSATPEVTVRFVHQKHVETAGLECAFCHQLEGGGMKMTLPGHDVCQGCHETAKSNSCMFCHGAKMGSQKPASHSNRWLIDHGREAYSGEQKKVCQYCHNGQFRKSCRECH